jgi:hypothetical protein
MNFNINDDHIPKCIFVLYFYELDFAVNLTSKIRLGKKTSYLVRVCFLM